MAGLGKAAQRIADLRGKHDRLSVTVIHRKSQAADQRLPKNARAKVHRQIEAKTKQMDEIKLEIERLTNEAKKS